MTHMTTIEPCKIATCRLTVVCGFAGIHHRARLESLDQFAEKYGKLMRLCLQWRMLPAAAAGLAELSCRGGYGQSAVGKRWPVCIAICFADTRGSLVVLPWFQ